MPTWFMPTPGPESEVAPWFLAVVIVGESLGAVSRGDVEEGAFRLARDSPRRHPSGQSAYRLAHPVDELRIHRGGGNVDHVARVGRLSVERRAPVLAERPADGVLVEHHLDAMGWVGRS